MDHSKLESAGELTFFFEGEPKWCVYVFRARSWKGTPAETEEMRPEWFSLDEIPYDEMWPSDRYWLPEILAGKSVFGEIYYDAHGDKLLDKPKLRFS